MAYFDLLVFVVLLLFALVSERLLTLAGPRRELLVTLPFGCAVLAVIFLRLLYGRELAAIGGTQDVRVGDWIWISGAAIGQIFFSISLLEQRGRPNTKAALAILRFGHRLQTLLCLR